MKLILLKDNRYGYEMRLLCQLLSNNTTTNNTTINDSISSSSSNDSNSTLASVCLLNSNNQRLRITRNDNGGYHVGFQSDNDLKMNKKGKGTAFFLVHVFNDENGTTHHRIKSCSEECNGLPVYIGFNDQGSFASYQEQQSSSSSSSSSPSSSTSTEDINISKFFTITIIESYDNIDKIKSNSITLLKKANGIVNNDSNNNNNSKCLRHWELQRFVMEGYVHVPSVVNQETIKNCLMFLNYQLGLPGAITAGGAQQGLGKLSGSISNSKEIRALLYESLHIVENILGENNCDIENPSAQIAFRFPEYDNKDAPKVIDSKHWHTDGLRKGRSHGFSLLLGICLNDVDDDYSGNLLVYPGSHFMIHQCSIGPHGDIDKAHLKSLKENQNTFLYEDYEDNNENNDSNDKTNNANDNVDIDANEINNNDDHHINEPLDLPSLGNPYQLKSRAGDIVLLHPDLAHEGGPNFSYDIRKMVYFRLRVKTINADWDDVVKQHQLDLFADMKNKKLKRILESMKSFDIMTGPCYEKH